MEQQSKEAAWSVGVWGILSVIYGTLILAWPGITLKVFLIIIGIYLLVSGLLLTLGSLVGRSGYWVGGAIMGAISAIAGLYLFAHPQISALAIITVIAIWSIVVGSIQIMAGFEARANDWWLIFAGTVQALFGLYIFANPKGGALAIIWLIGLSAVINGIVLTVAAFNHKSLART
jgi:uncharacterized membrane protein HdeD (DUF308 family)